MTEQTQAEKPLRVIKKYSNRKLYDVEEKRYVTLQEIKKLLQDGYSVQVVDRDTGEDISRQTLAKILLELESHHHGILPIGLLKDMVVKSQESALEYLRKSVTATKDAISQIEHNAQKQIHRIVEKGQLTEQEAKRFVQDVMDMAERGKSNLETMFEDQYKSVLSRFRFNQEQHAKVEETVEQRVERIERKLDLILAFLATEKGWHLGDEEYPNGAAAPTGEPTNNGG